MHGNLLVTWDMIETVASSPALFNNPFQVHKEEVMKSFSIILVLAGLILCPFFNNVEADPGINEIFYKVCIEKKIVQCLEKGELINSRGENLRQYGQKRSEQAQFYQEQEERLVQKMMQQKISKPHKIHHFLIKAYYDNLK